MVDWVEVRGRTVDVAVAAAMQELGITDRDSVDIEVIQEPERGFLGLGGRDAIVRVKPRPQGRRRRRGRSPGNGRGGSYEREDRPRERTSSQPGNRQPGNRQGANRQGTSRQGATGPGRAQSGRGPGRDQGGRSADRGNVGSFSRGNPGGGRDLREGESVDRGQPRGRGPGRDTPRPARLAPSNADPHEQAPMVEQFLAGLLESFGLDGRVVVGVDDEVVVANIEGEQTEALVGPRGSVMEAIHEITKTVLHRQVSDTARVRIDISGYAERRRQALSIYASQLIDQVLGEGGEIMLEPMSAADRKVIHDAVAARDGVESYSEGEPPRRFVVIATTDDVGTDDGAGADDDAGADEPPEDTSAPEEGAAEVQEELDTGGVDQDEDEDEPSSST